LSELPLVRYDALQQLFNWLEDEGEIAGWPMAKMRPPKIPEKPVPVLSDDHVRLLLADGSDKASQPGIARSAGSSWPRDWISHSPPF
jgi:site-specific recombinase XerD